MVLLPEAGVVPDERGGERAARGEYACTAVVVAVRVDGGYVLHLVEPVCLLVRKLGPTQILLYILVLGRNGD